METRSVVAEMFISSPTHFWVLPVAGVIAYYGLKLSESSTTRSNQLRGYTYLVLIALAVIPNGFYALFPPTPDVTELLASNELAPNYKGRLYLDAFYAFSGWALSGVVKLKFGR